MNSAKVKIELEFSLHNCHKSIQNNKHEMSQQKQNRTLNAKLKKRDEFLKENYEAINEIVIIIPHAQFSLILLLIGNFSHNHGG